MTKFWAFFVFIYSKLNAGVTYLGRSETNRRNEQIQTIAKFVDNGINSVFTKRCYRGRRRNCLRLSYLSAFFATETRSRPCPVEKYT